MVAIVLEFTTMFLLENYFCLYCICIPWLLSHLLFLPTDPNPQVLRDFPLNIGM